MAEANSLNTAGSRPLEISSNTFSNITFENQEHLHDFALVNSQRVASLLHVLMEVGQDLDGGFLADTLKIANDLAYQVQQALVLMAEHSDAGGNHV